MDTLALSTDECFSLDLGPAGRSSRKERQRQTDTERRTDRQRKRQREGGGGGGGGGQDKDKVNFIISKREILIKELVIVFNAKRERERER